VHNGELAKKVPSFTFNAKRMSNNIRCDVSVKANVSHLDENNAAFWVWLKLK